MRDNGRPSRRSMLRAITRAGLVSMIVSPVVAAAVTPTAIRSSAQPIARPSGGFGGRAVDLATGRPVAGVLVDSSPFEAIATTDHNGRYTLNVPTGSYTLRIAAPGYLEITLLNQVASESFTLLDLELIPSSPTTDQQLLLYQRLVKQSVSPFIKPDLARADQFSAGPSVWPTTIQVNYGTAAAPLLTPVALEAYVKGVVPNEMPASWPASALQAQAVAARSYGLAGQIAVGWVYPDARSQVYNPNYHTSTTDAAVEATAGVVMTYGGAVISAYFFAQCNGVATHNSESATIWLVDGNGNLLTNSSGQYECALAGWSYVAYCRSRPCAVHAAYGLSNCGYDGHGVGMCQWGAFYRSVAGESYQSILNDYYSAIGIATIAEGTPTSTPVSQLYLPRVSD